jgi:DNA-binding MarR family transcriptional regulator
MHGRTDDKDEAFVRGPGHLIRRLQQVSVSVFHSALERVNVTPLQHTVLIILDFESGLDQKTIAHRAVLDTTTVGDVLRRLERRNLIMREASPTDKRYKVVSITEKGRELVQEARGLVAESRKYLLSPLSADERDRFLNVVERLLAFHEAQNSFGRSKPWPRD